MARWQAARAAVDPLCRSQSIEAFCCGEKPGFDEDVKKGREG